MAETVASNRTPHWLVAAAGVGVLWNVYGVYQFASSLSKTAEDSMRAGMTQAQADLYLSLPAWVTVVFAVGVFGGLAGSVALLANALAAKGDETGAAGALQTAIGLTEDPAVRAFLLQTRRP